MATLYGKLGEFRENPIKDNPEQNSILGRKFKHRNRKCAETIESITNEKNISE